MNSESFHNENGHGYKFIGKAISYLDKFNPQISSNIAKVFLTGEKYGEKRDLLMKEELKISEMRKISKELDDIVSCGLKY